MTKGSFEMAHFGKLLVFQRRDILGFEAVFVPLGDTGGKFRHNVFLQDPGGLRMESTGKFSSRDSSRFRFIKKLGGFFAASPTVVLNAT